MAHLIVQSTIAPMETQLASINNESESHVHDHLDALIRDTHTFSKAAFLTYQLAELH